MSLIAKFYALPNPHKIGEMFIEDMLRKKIRLDWTTRELEDHNYVQEQLRESKQKDPNPFGSLNRTMALSGNWSRAQIAFAKKGIELSEYIERFRKSD